MEANSEGVVGETEHRLAHVFDHGWIPKLCHNATCTGALSVLESTFQKILPLDPDTTRAGSFGRRHDDPCGDRA